MPELFLQSGQNQNTSKTSSVVARCSQANCHTLANPASMIDANAGSRRTVIPHLPGLGLARRREFGEKQVEPTG
jgi:hypothetical protein